MIARDSDSVGIVLAVLNASLLLILLCVLVVLTIKNMKASEKSSTKVTPIQVQPSMSGPQRTTLYA